MPSIFARSRTSSNTNTLSPPDEFGRVPSRSSIKGITAALSSPDKKSSKGSNANAVPDHGDRAPIEDGFLPTNLVGYSATPSPSPVGDAQAQAQTQPEQAYGYLSYQRHVVLGIGDVTRLVDAIAAELGSRGLQTPFLFSNTALDISPSAIRRLINAFLATIPQSQSHNQTQEQGQGRAATLPRPSTNSVSTSSGQKQLQFLSQRNSSNSNTNTNTNTNPSSEQQHYHQHPQSQSQSQTQADAQKAFREEVQFAGPHDLGMVLRWGLARVVRVVNGHEVRGIIGWDVYLEWRAGESAQSYPPHAFASLLEAIRPPTRSLLLTLLTLLTRLLAHSTSSGLTPSALAALFGPLVFGLGNGSGVPYASGVEKEGEKEKEKERERDRVGVNLGAGVMGMPFMHAYAAWMRAANAVEHVLLAFVRLMEVGGVGGGGDSSSAGAGYGTAGIPIPGRLRSWVKGYPAVLVPIEKMDRTRVVNVNVNANTKNTTTTANTNTNTNTKRTVRVAVVRRNVRMYSPDLVKSCGSWGRASPSLSLGPGFSMGSSSNSGSSSGSGAANSNDLRSSKIWARICPCPSDKGTSPLPLPLPPRYSDAYRKKMDLSAGVVPDYNNNNNNNYNNFNYNYSYRTTTSPPPLSFSTTSTSTSSTTTTNSLYSPSSPSSSSRSRSAEGEGLDHRDRDRDRDRFRNLTDLKWGVFEESGFAESMTGDGDGYGSNGTGVLQGKLQFDLNESRRSERYTKRATLTWADFSSSGFTREDPLLSSTLQFSAPLKGQVNDWPAHSAELQRKLKKAQKSLPVFGWDTSPVVGGEEIVEEGFVDVFCDLVYGGGWMEREGTFKECSWALVEFKALPETPTARTETPLDPRTDTLMILFEEFVPLEYRTQLLRLSQSSGMSLPSVRKHLPAFFSGGRSRAWKPAATLNGKPYRVGAVPRSPTAREVEFEGLLRGEGGATKVIRLDRALGVGVGGSSSVISGISGIGIGNGIGAQAMEKKSKSERAVPSVSVTSPLVAPALKSIATEPTPSSIVPISSVLVSSPVPVPIVQTSPPNINNTNANANDAAGASASAPHPPPLPAKDKDKNKESEPKRRFKFSVPGTGGANRHAMLVPAEYDNTLEFDVRLTALSDEEGSSPSGSMEGERVGGKGKKMEPWVDILVAGHERRLGSQDAERSLGLGQNSVGVNGNGNGNGADGGSSAGAGAGGVAAKQVEEELEPVPVRMSDPEEATKELERALEEVKAQQPPTDDEDSEYNVSSALRSTIQKRPNYFDLHPERRLKAIHTGGSFDDNNFYGLSEPSVAPRDSVYTYGSEGDMEPASDTFTYDEERDIEVPAFVDEDDPRTPEDMRRGRLKSDSVVLPLASASPVTPLSADGKSKTAALIEMYREKERQSIASPVPSRLPVRSALTENMGVNVGVNVKAASPTTTPTPLQQIQIQQIELPAPQDAVPGIPETDSVVEEEEEEDGILSEEDDTGPLDPPTFGLENISRASPLRYVHGAPLHNVLEDEEEEDEEA